MRCHTKPQYLNIADHTNLMVLPWAHFDLLRAGIFDLDYLMTLAGLFNIAGSMANLKHRHDKESLFSDIQMILVDLIADQRCPNEQESETLASALHEADRLILKYPKNDLVRVISYVDRMIASGKATPIL